MGGGGELFLVLELVKKSVFGSRKTPPRSQKRAPTTKMLFFREGGAPGAHVKPRCGTPHSFLVVAAGEIFLVPKCSKFGIFASEKLLPGHENELRLPNCYFSVRVGYLEPT